jgi:hypothetical protein
MLINLSEKPDLTFARIYHTGMKSKEIRHTISVAIFSVFSLEIKKYDIYDSTSFI